MSAGFDRSGRTIARIQGWCRFYTRGLPTPVAAERQAEIASDLNDELAFKAARAHDDRAIAQALRARAIKGSLADLAWRRHQLRAARISTVLSAGWYPRSLLVVSYVLGFGMLAWGVFVVVRWAARVAIVERMPTLDHELEGVYFVSVAAALAICLCGLLLLRREKTRSVGALWVAASAYLLIGRSFAMLEQASTTANFAVNFVPGWAALETAISVGMMLFLLSIAIWWMPRRARAHRITE